MYKAQWGKFRSILKPEKHLLWFDVPPSWASGAQHHPKHFAAQDSGFVEKEAVAPPFEMEQAALMIPESPWGYISFFLKDRACL